MPELPKVRYTGLPPARGFAFPATVGATVQLASGSGVIYGWAVEETTGLAGARLVLGDGASGVGVNIGAPITLQASESTRDFLPGGGWLFQQGIVVTVTSGSVDGIVFAVLLPPDQVDALSDPLRSDYA